MIKLTSHNEIVLTANRCMPFDLVRKVVTKYGEILVRGEEIDAQKFVERAQIVDLPVTDEERDFLLEMHLAYRL